MLACVLSTSSGFTLTDFFLRLFVVFSVVRFVVAVVVGAFYGLGAFCVFGGRAFARTLGYGGARQLAFEPSGNDFV